MNVTAIVAMSRNFVIGNKGKIPWHSTKDFEHFKETTMGQIIVMGRKTWDSLPEKNKPLTGRLNIVLTKNKDLELAGAKVVHSVEECVALCEAIGSDVFVIGGAEIYKLFDVHYTKQIITTMKAKAEGDVTYPWPSGSWYAGDVKQEKEFEEKGVQFVIRTILKRKD